MRINNFDFLEHCVPEENEVPSPTLSNEQLVWRIYIDSEHLWRWTKLGAHGKILDVSCRGYTRRTECIENARGNGFSEDLPSEPDPGRSEPCLKAAAAVTTA